MRGSIRKPPKDQYEVLQQQIDALKARVETLENQRRPSLPIYDSANFPAVAQEGEVCIAPLT